MRRPAAAAGWCALTMAAGLAAQHLHRLWLASGARAALALALVVAGAYLAALAAAVVRDRRRALALAASIPFAVVVLTGITLAVVAGTLVLQRQPPALFDQIYGAAAGPLRLLFLDDLFHALWFEGLELLAALALAAAAVRLRPWRRANAGRAAAHLGAVVVLLGGLLGGLAGLKGRLDLEVGQEGRRLVWTDWRSGAPRAAELPFTVRLDDFHIEAYEPSYRVYVFERGAGPDEFRAVAAIDPVRQLGQNVPIAAGLDLRLEEFRAQAARDAEKEEALPSPPVHELELDGRRLAVEPEQIFEEAGGYHVKVGRFLPHFTYDLEQRQARSLSDQPENPALWVEVRRGGPDGESAYAGWLFANMPGFSMAGHEGDRPAWTPVYRFRPDGGGTETGPRARISVLAGGRVETEKEIELSHGRDFLAFGGRFIAVLRLRDSEIKNFYSLVSIVEDGRVVRSRRISVNDPMSHRGYALYQSNYDPDNLRYSGLDVVRDPGLPLVYIGLAAMLAGVVHVLYLRRRPDRAPGPARPEEVR